MKNFLRVVAVLAVVGIVVIAGLFVFDVVSVADTRDALQRVLLMLGVVALGGLAVSMLTHQE